VLVLFVLVVALDLSSAVPHATRLRLVLDAPPDTHFDSATITLSREGEVVVRSRRYDAAGLSASLDDEHDLLAGHYEVHVDLRSNDAPPVTREGEFDAPADGLVIVHLHP
jgi:hypothetical protein